MDTVWAVIFALLAAYVLADLIVTVIVYRRVKRSYWIQELAERIRPRWL